MPDNAPPAVDEGRPPGPLTFLRRELAPRPGRLGNTLRLVVLVLITVTISETFRIPEAAVSAYIVLFISREERASTVLGAAIAGIAVMLAIGLTIIVFMASLSEPALRLPLIALITFIAMFLARAAPLLGPALFAAGFILAYGLTLGDQVIGLALQPGSVADTAEFALPEIIFLPPDEVLVHFLLWLALAVAIPIALVIVANLLTGRDPALLLRAALAERLDAAAKFCAGEARATRALADLTREGTGELLKLHHLSRPSRLRETDRELVFEVNHLSLALLATTRLPAGTLPARRLAGAATTCREAAWAVRQGTTLQAVTPLSEETNATTAAGPIVAELSHQLAAIRGALAVAPGTDPAEARTKRPRASLLAPDAFTNPGNSRFALKVTLAVMACYLIVNLTNWPGIHTCIITCFFVSLGTVGETVHKATLRFTGCLIGGGLGIGTILLLMPMMTSLGDLLAVLAVVTLLAGWVGSGSERSAYAGWQIGLAFYLAILQGFGPTLDMETARDRILGILLGNLMVFAIFTTLWPVRVEHVVRAALAKAVEQLATLMEPSDSPDVAAEAAARQAFSIAIGQARAVIVNDRYERRAPRDANGRRVIDATVVLDVQALMVPVSVILGLRTEPIWFGMPPAARQEVQAHDRAMAAWFRGSAGWLLHGAGAAALDNTLPASAEWRNSAALEPAADPFATWGFWSNVLHRDIRAILNQIGPAAIIGVLPAMQEGIIDAT